MDPVIGADGFATTAVVRAADTVDAALERELREVVPVVAVVAYMVPALLEFALRDAVVVAGA